MKQTIVLVFLLLQNFMLSAQTSGFIKDATTKEAVPYVNIWIKGQDSGTSADAEGKFFLAKTETGQSLIFSAVGYESKIIAVADIPETIYLTPQAYQLAEVAIKPKKKLTATIEKIKGSRVFPVNWAKDNIKHPSIIAKYIPYPDATPFIQSVKIKTFTLLKKAIFNLRFYSVADNGQPKDFLYDKNILCEVTKGTHSNNIAVADLHIAIPENGIFIAYESLAIEENKCLHPYEFVDKNGKLIKGNTEWYDPGVEIITDKKNTDTWHWNGGSWKKYEDWSLAMEISLTN